MCEVTGGGNLGVKGSRKYMRQEKIGQEPEGYIVEIGNILKYCVIFCNRKITKRQESLII